MLVTGKRQIVMKILLIEPYFGGSHQTWAEGYQRFSEHEVRLLTLPAQFWKWRMQGGAVTLARLFNEGDFQPDVILASDMFDLSTFRALTRHSTLNIPIALYFHESQFTYPQNKRQQHGWRYSFTNYVSALAADHVFFNSPYHQQAFFENLPRMLKHFGDFNELESVDLLREKSSVLSLGIDLHRLDTYQPETKNTPESPLILWNHRWEDEKNPRAFFNALYRLAEDGFPFRVAIAGENVRQIPDEFLQFRERLGERVVQFGYLESFADYARLLWQADYVVSTAYQEFFGGAVAEAIYCRCIPILPKRLNYPDLVPSIAHAACLYPKERGLYYLLRRHLRGEFQVDTSALRDHVAQFDWSITAPRYDVAFEELVSG